MAKGTDKVHHDEAPENSGASRVSEHDDQAEQGSAASASAAEEAQQSPKHENAMPDLSEEGSAETDETNNPQTSCPNCQTVFEVHPEFLTSDDTRVRCGECLIIFDSLTNLKSEEMVDDDDFMVDEDGNIVESDSMLSGERLLTDDVSGTGSFRNTSSLTDARAAALADLTGEGSHLDMTYTDVDLYSEDADLPEVFYFDHTNNTSRYDTDTNHADETFSDTLFSGDMTAVELSEDQTTDEDLPLENSAILDKTVDFVTDESPPSPLVFKYRDTEPEQLVTKKQNASESLESSATTSAVDELLEQARRHAHQPDEQSTIENEKKLFRELAPEKKQSANYKLLMALTCLVLIVSLYGYRERASLLADSRIRPVLQVACKYLNCSVPVQKDLASLKVLKRTVYSHPSINNALVIDLSLANQADFEQPYPLLEIRLTDRNGGLVVKSRFLPEQYLDRWQPEELMGIGKRVDVVLTVEDPGQTATSFELDFQ